MDGPRTGLAAMLVGAFSLACLTPMTAAYVVDMEPQETESIRHDRVDDELVYNREGLQVRVAYLSDAQLRAQIPGADNPYVEADPDPRLGYRPKPFTVFQVTVRNPTFAKVRLDPDNVVLVTDQGEQLESYAINRVDARGGIRNFETYFLSRGVQTGNQQKLYLERLGKVRETIYHRNSPVFKGKTYTGKIAFAALPAQTKRVRLVIYDFVLSFDVNDEPAEQITLEFPFAVQQGIHDASGG